MNTVDLSDIHTLRCSCGAQSKNTAESRQRFLKRHPKLCSERRAFAQ